MKDYHSSIARIIDEQNLSFGYFLKTYLLNERSWDVIQEIVKRSDIYVFSGIIRDFLTGSYSGVRDLDFVLTEKGQINRLLDWLIKKELVQIHFNQFNGIKMKLGDYHIDIWHIQDTWGIKQEKKEATVDALIDSAFFNFQAIVYSLRNKQFIYHSDFCRFLETKVMDIVYEKNPSIPLCIVNVCHYWTLYNYNISSKLVRWLKLHYRKDMDLTEVQLKHFGSVFYPQDYINSFLKSLFIQL